MQSLVCLLHITKGSYHLSRLGCIVLSDVSNSASSIGCNIIYNAADYFSLFVCYVTLRLSQPQVEILGMCENEDLYSMKTRVYTTYECKTAYLKKFGKTGTYDLNASGVITRNGIQEKVYQRILIINRKFAPNS